MIAGKECTPRPLKARELGEVEREGLRLYKEQFLESYMNGCKHYPEDIRIQKMDEKNTEVAGWDVTNLPAKRIYDPKYLKVTDKLRQWLSDNLGEEAKLTHDMAIQMATSVCLQSEVMKPETYQELVGELPPKPTKVSFIQWWVTGSIEGMITMVWTAFKHHGVTKEEVAEALMDDQMTAAKVAKDIAELSQPSGN